MTKEDFEEYLVLNDAFEYQCNLIASIFSEVFEDFMHAGGWKVNPPLTTCTGYYEPGYVYSDDGKVSIPFRYIYMTEDELNDVVRNHPEMIEEMIDETA